MWPRGFRELWASRFSWHSAREGGEVVCLTNRPPLPPGMFLVLIFTRGWVDPRDMVRSEGNMSLKNPVTPPGIDPGTVRLVAQRLNHYATPDPLFILYRTWMKYYKPKTLTFVITNAILHLFSLAHSWWREKRVSVVKYLLCLVRFTFSDMLVTDDQAWLNMTPTSLLKLFLSRFISVVSSTMRSTYPGVLYNMEAQMKSLQCPVLFLRSATADFSGWYRHMYLWY